MDIQTSDTPLSAAELPEFPDSADLERFTGTPASTWRYWAHIGSGPPSFKLGRRRVWKKASVLAWLAELENQPAPDRQAVVRGRIAELDGRSA